MRKSFHELKNLEHYVLYELFTSITHLGTPFFYSIVILILFHTNVYRAMQLAGILITVELLCAIVKLVYHKPRPKKIASHHLLSFYDAGSFPSIHSARITVLALFLHYSYPFVIHRYLSLLLIMGVAYSRIYLKRHFLVDVIAGIVLGSIICLGGLFIL